MAADREAFAQVAPWLAIAGNALLTSPSQAGAAGEVLFDAGLWEELAACEDAEIAAAAAELAAFARGESAAQRASVEFAHLFVGPPKPAVAPWETFYRQQGCAVGFGEATHTMRAALRDNGLELAQAGRQYEDHMGIELLLASELCRRAGDVSWDTRTGCRCPSQVECDDEEGESAERAAKFVRTRPLSWMPTFRQAVERERPQGFYTPLLELTQALLELVA